MGLISRLQTIQAQDPFLNGNPESGFDSFSGPPSVNVTAAQFAEVDALLNSVRHPAGYFDMDFGWDISTIDKFKRFQGQLETAREEIRNRVATGQMSIDQLRASISSGDFSRNFADGVAQRERQIVGDINSAYQQKIADGELTQEQFQAAIDGGFVNKQYNYGAMSPQERTQYETQISDTLQQNIQTKLADGTITQDQAQEMLATAQDADVFTKDAMSQGVTSLNGLGDVFEAYGLDPSQAQFYQGAETVSVPVEGEPGNVSFYEQQTRLPNAPDGFQQNEKAALIAKMYGDPMMGHVLRKVGTEDLPSVLRLNDTRQYDQEAGTVLGNLTAKLDSSELRSANIDLYSQFKEATDTPADNSLKNFDISSTGKVSEATKSTGFLDALATGIPMAIGMLVPGFGLGGPLLAGFLGATSGAALSAAAGGDFVDNLLAGVGGGLSAFGFSNLANAAPVPSGTQASLTQSMGGDAAALANAEQVLGLNPSATGLPVGPMDLPAVPDLTLDLSGLDPKQSLFDLMNSPSDTPIVDEFFNIPDPGSNLLDEAFPDLTSIGGSTEVGQAALQDVFGVGGAPDPLSGMLPDVQLDLSGDPYNLVGDDSLLAGADPIDAVIDAEFPQDPSILDTLTDDTVLGGDTQITDSQAFQDLIGDGTINTIGDTGTFDVADVIGNEGNLDNLPFDQPVLGPDDPLPGTDFTPDPILDTPVNPPPGTGDGAGTAPPEDLTPFDINDLIKMGLPIAGGLLSGAANVDANDFLQGRKDTLFDMASETGTLAQPLVDPLSDALSQGGFYERLAAGLQRGEADVAFGEALEASRREGGRFGGVGFGGSGKGLLSAARGLAEAQTTADANAQEGAMDLGTKVALADVGIENAAQLGNQPNFNNRFSVGQGLLQGIDDMFKAGFTF